MNLTKQEIEFLIAGLDLLARSQKDVLSAANELLPLRAKLNAEMQQLLSDKQTETERLKPHEASPDEPVKQADSKSPVNRPKK